MRILKLIKNNSFITYKELSKELNITEKTVYKNIEKLKQKALLKRIGPAKGGYWKELDG